MADGARMTSTTKASNAKASHTLILAALAVGLLHCRKAPAIMTDDGYALPAPRPPRAKPTDLVGWIAECRDDAISRHCCVEGSLAAKQKHGENVSAVIQLRAMGQHCFDEAEAVASKP